MTERSPFVQRSRLRRLILWLAALDLVLIAAALVVWSAVRPDDDAKENVFNQGLRGSKPPAGETIPKLDGVGGLHPPVGTASLRGDAIQLVATCLDCRSGEIIGGYLGRLTVSDIPDGARVVLVGWSGDVRAWRKRWHVDEKLVELHAATAEEAAAELRALFGIAPRGGAQESGITFLYDTRGRWRSTYFIGQLDREDIEHDLRVLSTR